MGPTGAVPSTVAFYNPLTKPEQLPKPDTDIEREVMDWKAPGQMSQSAFHKAKDVAAFANHLGGVILVGACEGRGGKLAKYEWMDQKQAQQVADALSQAVAQKCDPIPDVSLVPIANETEPAKVVLAVNVAPSLRLVGVKAEVAAVDDWDDKNKAFVYPVRTGTVTRFLTASELPMMMTPHIRRVAVLLSRIPVNAHIRIVWHRRDLEPEFLFLGVDEEQNVMRYKSIDTPTERTLPLDGIASVYEGETPDGTRFGWRILPSSDLIASNK